MTNKINGIDVSECPLFDKKTGCYHTFNGECVKDSCALYKWLLEYKFLKQELDIKEKMLDKFMIGSGEILEKLQKENEELKARLKTLDDEVLTIEITPDEFERYKKYEQALEEIRVFSENFCEDKCPFYENEYSEVCNEACLLDNIVNPILKKIDGVLNDRD